MDESEDKNENHLSEQNWMKFIKYVIHHKHSMTPEKLKQKPFEEMFKKQCEKLDTEEGESSNDIEENESPKSSDMSEQDSESDTTADDTEVSEPRQTNQIHNGLNNTMNDEDNSSDPENDSSKENSIHQIQPYRENGEQNNEQEDKLLITKFEVKVENRKLKGSYPFQLINKFSYSRLFPEITKKYGEFILFFNPFKVSGQ